MSRSLLLHTPFYIIILAVYFTVIPLQTFAQSVTDIRDKISSRKEEIEALEKEIAEYTAQLDTIGREKRTLESAVRELDISRNKVRANIALIQKQIDATSATIGELIVDIDKREQKIASNQAALAGTLKRMHIAESATLLETILNSEDVSEVWNGIDDMQRFQLAMRDEVSKLTKEKAELESARYERETAKNRLIEQRKELSTQKRALDINRSAKNSLLKETSNRESTYQELIATKQKAKEQFEREMQDLESQLKYILDPTSIPPAGKGVFAWPISPVRITQYFGNTAFAKSGAYNGRGHNGMDFGVPIGTPVKAVLAGNVRATGNTDAYPGCYSYGKWILIEHVNGLSTLYAHLSDIAVSPGEAVATREVIGYSGNTGYSTGPHLHLTVYASDAVQLVRLGDVKTRTNCANATIPVASWSGYLNPLDYLP